jgi:hypothetical protein
MNLPDAPVAREGFFAAHFFTVKDQQKSSDFDVRILGGKLIKPEDPCSIKLANTWNPAAKVGAYNTGAGQGRATPWTITFNMAQAARSGKAHLRLGLASTSLRQFDVAVNGQQVATVDHLLNDGSIGRNGIHGVWSERDVAFDESLLKQGTNTITLTVPAGTVTSGIIYDYLRLEVE